MNKELSHARAIWQGDTYIGTIEPCYSAKAKCTHNMDVDYWFTKNCDAWISMTSESSDDFLAPVDIKDWYVKGIISGELVEVASLKHSQDIRDVWFFGRPSWLTPKTMEELRIEGAD